MLRWMTYAIVLTIVFGLAASLWEQAAIIRRWSSRLAWILAGFLSLAVPIVQSLSPQLSSRQVIEMSAGASRVEGWDAPVVSLLSGAGHRMSVLRLDERWLMWAWLTMSIGTAAYFASGYRAIRREHLQSHQSVIAGQTVTVTKNLGPAVIGWLRPHIVIPRWIDELSDEEQSLIIAHEREHLLAHDGRLIGLGIIAVIAFPWNAALWWVFFRLRLAIEFDCDARVLRKNSDALQYGKVLLHASRVPAARGLTAATLFESRTTLERRMKAFLRSGAESDVIVASVFAIASLVIGVAGANVDSPGKNVWPETNRQVDQASLPSPKHQLHERFASIVDVVEAFEPKALQPPSGMTSYVFLVLDRGGRVASHHADFRPSLERDAISVDAAKATLEQLGATQAGTYPIILQVALRDTARSPDAIVLAIDPSVTALSLRAPHVDLPAIRGARDWLEASVIRRARTERLILEAADSDALESGLPEGEELWIVLDSKGKYLNGGRREIIADPNLSRHFVEAQDHTYRVEDVLRGTAVRDRSGDRIRVSWHWLAPQQ